MEKKRKLKDIISKSNSIGNKYSKIAIKEVNIPAARVANQAYNNSIKAIQTQILLGFKKN